MSGRRPPLPCSPHSPGRTLTAAGVSWKEGAESPSSGGQAMFRGNVRVSEGRGFSLRRGGGEERLAREACRAAFCTPGGLRHARSLLLGDSGTSISSNR